MAKAKETEFEKPIPAVDEEDEQTLAAIDEGIRDAKAGRTVSPEEVHKRLIEILHLRQAARQSPRL
jgi:predicted transcriptional regulator